MQVASSSTGRAHAACNSGRRSANAAQLLGARGGRTIGCSGVLHRPPRLPTVCARDAPANATLATTPAQAPPLVEPSLARHNPEASAWLDKVTADAPCLPQAISLIDTAFTHIKSAIPDITPAPTIHSDADATMAMGSRDGNAAFRLHTFTAPTARWVMRCAGAILPTQASPIGSSLSRVTVSLPATGSPATPNLEIECSTNIYRAGDKPPLLLVLALPARLCILLHEAYEEKYYMSVPPGAAEQGVISMAQLQARVESRIKDGTYLSAYTSPSSLARSILSTAIAFHVNPLCPTAMQAAREDVQALCKLWATWRKHDLAEAAAAGCGSGLSPAQEAECEARTWALARALSRDPAARAIAHLFSEAGLEAMLGTCSGDARVGQDA